MINYIITVSKIKIITKTCLSSTHRCVRISHEVKSYPYTKKVQITTENTRKKVQRYNAHSSMLFNNTESESKDLSQCEAVVCTWFQFDSRTEGQNRGLERRRQCGLWTPESDQIQAYYSYACCRWKPQASKTRGMGSIAPITLVTRGEYTLTFRQLHGVFFTQ